MEKLSRHIEKLLVQHDYVVVPGFGGFVIQQQSAEILVDKIKAPRSTVGFNPLMLHNDGLLIIEVSRYEKITYRQAITFVQNEVENLRLRLNSDETVPLGRIGHLQIDGLGNILFFPENNIEFLPQNLGLNDLFLTPKKKQKGKEVTITLPSRKIYKYAAVILMILGLFLASPKVTDVRITDYASFVPKFTERTVEKHKKSEVVLPEKIVEMPHIKADTTEVSLKYHVIVASLPTKESADKFCNYLKEDNFKEAHTLEPVRTYRIAFNLFPTNRKLLNLWKTSAKPIAGLKHRGFFVNS